MADHLDSPGLTSSGRGRRLTVSAGATRNMGLTSISSRWTASAGAEAEPGSARMRSMRESILAGLANPIIGSPCRDTDVGGFGELVVGASSNRS